ncbi:MAG: hypothetical protein QW607_10310 [Desulfurococcaceae archaeon]
MPEDRRPPKKWWNNCQKACVEYEIADDCDAFCGWLWYHGEEEGTPYKEAREALFEKDDDKEGDKEDKRPPKDWWDKCHESCIEYGVAEDCNAFCGWLWYHGEEEGNIYALLRRAFMGDDE